MRSEGEGNLSGTPAGRGTCWKGFWRWREDSGTTSDHRAGAEQMDGARKRQALYSAMEPDAKDKFHYSCIYIYVAKNTFHRLAVFN